MGRAADHRHPLLAADLIERVTEALAGGAELVIPVLPVTDTVKVVEAGGTITATVGGLTGAAFDPAGLGYDDFSFRVAAVPEPSTWAAIDSRRGPSDS